jgi:Ca2+-transporting ATPase
MGRSGTDVAREASDMVLTDDAFASIAAAVEEGRVVFDNVRKVTYFLVSTGVATIVSILTALVAGWPLPYVPAALLWLNVVTNGLDDVALAFDPAEPDVLERPPRGHAEAIVTPVLWVRSTLVGLVMAVGTLWVYRWTAAAGLPLDQQRGAALTTLVIAMAVHTLSVRSERRLLLTIDPRTNPLLMAAIVLPTIVHVGALSWQPTRTILQVGPVTGGGWVRIALIGVATMVASDLHKLWCRAAERRVAARRTELEGAWG